MAICCLLGAEHCVARPSHFNSDEARLDVSIYKVGRRNFDTAPAIVPIIVLLDRLNFGDSNAPVTGIWRYRNP